MAKRALSRSSLALLGLTGLLAAAGVFIAVFPGERPGEGEGLLPAFDAQGHRGARGLYPENTWPAFQAALAIGVTTLEMDLGMTADGVVVVYHDRRLDPSRTRGPEGEWIAEPGPALVALNAVELAAYDVGRARPDSRVAERFPGQVGMDGIRIPRLAEILELTERASGGTVRYNIEIKTSPFASEETAAPEVMAEAVVEVLRAAEVAERATVQSFDWRSLKRIQEIAPDVATVYLTAEQSWLDNLERGRDGISPWTAGLDIDDHDGSIARAILAAGGAVWSPYFRDLQPADLSEARRLGLKVVVWTVNDPADMASLIELGVDGIITDYPDRLRAVMAEMGLPLPPAFGTLPSTENN